MNQRIRLFTALLATLVVGLAALLSAAPALAVRTVGHGHGVLWSVDHVSWIGSYRLDDGSTGFCLDVEKPQPAGTDVDYLDGSSTGEYSAADSARLAYIARAHGTPANPLEAASAQLAVWSVAGLGGHDQAWFARRANEAAADVLASANRILAEANAPGGASTGVSATAELTLDGPGGSVRSELVVDYLAGRATVPAGSFDGRMTLTGATFEGGSRTRTVPNGSAVAILPDQAGSTETVSVDVEYRALPFGPGFRLGRNTGPNQSLLVNRPYPRDARASDRETAPNALPFTPRVETETSEAVAEPGAELTDTLRVAVHPESATGDEWGVYRADDGTLAPIPVVVTSMLHGPFPARPEPSPTAPLEGPAVCVVDTVVDHGPGTYETSPCTLPAPGFYVWTDSIDPARTAPEQGGDRLLPWASGFGVAAETTLVPALPTIETVASVSALTDPGCVSDRLRVAGLPVGIDPVEVRSTLLGPLPSLPEPESVPADWESFPVAGVVLTTVDTDGEHLSPCIPVTAPGHYYFIVESAASAPMAVPARAPAGRTTIAAEAHAPVPASSAPGTSAPVSLIPAISDLRVHTAESVELVPPAPPKTTPPAEAAPPTSSSPTPAPPAATGRLPLTGSPAGPTALATTLAVGALVVGLALAGLAGTTLPLRRRR